MAENISMTRIIDLPDATGQMSPDMYMPINAHPNPYGISAPAPGGIPYPEVSPSRQQGISQQSSIGLSENQMLELQQIGQQRLPQRDIPMESHHYTHDESIQPNYIPKPKITADYIQEYQEKTDKKIQAYEKEKRREEKVQNWMDELYQPFLLAIFYFIFSLPIVNRLIFQRFSFLQIYKEDGNFNLWGLCLKGFFFSSWFYLVNKCLTIISEF
jgi:hypothetical protein